MTEHNPEQWLEDAGQAATITITPNPEGMQLSVKFGEEKADLSNPTIVQGLALIGCEAIREAIRERMNVTSEEVARYDKPTTH